MQGYIILTKTWFKETEICSSNLKALPACFIEEMCHQGIPYCCNLTCLFGPFQIAGLLSALIVMVVTLAIGFLLDPLPKVNLRTPSNSSNMQVFGVCTG